ncbi:MAG: hypothetical protein EA387_00200 [Nitriliruptor sp.]|nr:MAG: hypothetical protein EA387_00200 [Nitriliruptor sp.]
MKRNLRILVLFLVLMAFWLVLSARLDPLFLVIGVASAAWIAWYTIAVLDHQVGERTDSGGFNPFAVLTYIMWLFMRQVVSGFSLAWVVVNPKLAPKPGVFRFRTGLTQPAARTILANSITLVPGTNTIEVEDEVFTVHAFNAASAADIAEAKVQRRIARIFRVPPDDPPTLEWEPLYDADVADQRPDGDVEVDGTGGVR